MDYLYPIILVLGGGGGGILEGCVWFGLVSFFFFFTIFVLQYF